MNSAEIYRAQSTKPLDSFVADFEKAAVKRGFSIHNRDNMAMADLYREKNHPMPEDFDLHMIKICKPDKSSQSFQTNIERAPLMPKFVMADIEVTECLRRVSLSELNDDLIAELTEQVLALEDYQAEP